MSKLSPYRINNNYRKDASPLKSTAYNQSNSKNQEKSKNSKYRNQTNHPKFYHDPDQSYKHFTEKKKKDNFSQFDLENVLQKNNVLASENEELFLMLQERGKIIVALERKLQDQIDRQVVTLQAIDIEKNKFIKDSQRRFKQYQKRIEELKEEMYHLHNDKYDLQLMMARQLEHNKNQLAKQQMIKINELTSHQASVRQNTTIEHNKIKGLLDLKHNEISQLNIQYRNNIERLKNEIIHLNNQIVHIEHLKKIQFSEFKMQYDNQIQSIHQHYLKEKEIMALERDMMQKKMGQIIESKENVVSKMLEEKKMSQIQKNIRENDLMETNEKLQAETRQLQYFYRKTSKDEIERLKYLNNNDISALEANKDAQTSHLLNQNDKLKRLIDLKSEEIRRLHEEISNQRRNTTEECKDKENMISQLKERIRQIEHQKLQQEQRLKIKWAQLRDADIKALKKYYEHQIQNLNNFLHEKTHVASKNRQLLYQQIQQKTELRKKFDIQITNLNAKILELQSRIHEMIINKSEILKTTHEQRQMTSTTLMRQTKDKERLNQNNEEERRKLQELILAKDKEIEELQNKITLLKTNAEKEIQQKNVEIQLIKEFKNGVEAELKKQKIFYENEVKKRDLLVKLNKQNYEVQLNRLKDNHRNQYDYMTKELTSEKNALEIQLNKSKNSEKMLRNQLANLDKKSKENSKYKEQEIKSEKHRLIQDKNQTEDKMTTYYTQEIDKLQKEISDLKKKLTLKEEDLRNLGDDYYKLQKKLDQVFESQQKLTRMESMIIQIGQDNNLVKNVAQLIKYRQNP